MWDRIWRRRRPAVRTLRLRSRGEMGDATRVAFQALAPDFDVYLGQAAYLQLGYVETLSALIASTTDLAHKEAISRAVGAALAKHQRLLALARERGDDPAVLMSPFREKLDAFRAATGGVRPQETMLAVHITASMLDDFYEALSVGYGDEGRRVARILQADDDRQAIVELIAAQIEHDPQLRSLLAMWGRRLVGDTILIARDALRTKRTDQASEEVVEPVFTELLGAHARRMEAMGLTA